MNMREEIEEYVSCSMTDEGIWVGDAGSIVAIVERHLAANKRQTEMSTIDEAARGLVEKIGAIGYVEGCDCPTCQSDRRKIVSIIAAAMREREEAKEGHGKPCYYCGDPCNDLSGNPSEWAIPLCHPDEPGIVKWHHIGCVGNRLARLDLLESGAITSANPGQITITAHPRAEVDR